jgi:tetratricopeptide (TPR) repeat protein
MQLLAVLTLVLFDMPWDAGVRALQAGRAAEAEAEFLRVCPGLAADGGGPHGYCLLMLGMAQQGNGRLDSARESFRASLVDLAGRGPEYAEAFAMSQRYLGELTGGAAGEELLRKALAIQVAMADPLPAAATRRRLADLLVRGGRQLAEAADLLTAAGAAFAASADPLTVERLELDAARGRLMLATGNARGAREAFFQVLRASQAYFGTTHRRTAQANLDLALALQADGEYARALPLIRKASWIQGRVSASPR